MHYIEVDIYILLISPESGQYHQISCVLSEDHYQMAAKWSSIRSGEAMGTRNSMAGFGSKLGTLGLWQLDKQRILYSKYVKTNVHNFSPNTFWNLSQFLGVPLWVILQWNSLKDDKQRRHCLTLTNKPCHFKTSGP